MKLKLLFKVNLVRILHYGFLILCLGCPLLCKLRLNNVAAEVLMMALLHLRDLQVLKLINLKKADLSEVRYIL